MSYCKLYIDSDLDQTSMEETLERGIVACVDLPGLEYSLFPNDGYRGATETSLPTYPVDRSRYYIEIDYDSTNEESKNKFNSAICKLIIWLRELFEFVVASCDFEDYIIQATGWNWTPEHPAPFTA